MDGTVRVVIEIQGEPGSERAMRWERSAAARDAGVFHLLGQAFEVARYDAREELPDLLAALFKGALLEKADVEEALGRIRDGQ